MMSKMFKALVGIILAAVVVTAADFPFAVPKGLKVHKLEALNSVLASTSASDSPTPNWSRMHRVSDKEKVGKTLSSLALSRVAKLAQPGYQNISSVDYYDIAYYVTVLVGAERQPVDLLFDTGSADTYATAANFTCDDWRGNPIARGACQMGPGYAGGFQYGPKKGEHLYVEYSDQTWMSGPMGYSDMEVAGIQVRRQQFAIVNETYTWGNGLTSGVLGLAFKSLTNSYADSSGPRGHNATDRDEYAPFFNNLRTQTKMSYFSLAIERNSSDGLVGWGGIPPVEVDGESYGITDIIIAEIIDREETADQYSFYCISPDGMQWGQTEDTVKYLYIVDSATSFLYLPSVLAAAVNAAFNPSAEWDPLFGAYFVDCDATAPDFNIVIDHEPFSMRGADLINENLFNPLTGKCATTISDGGSGPFVLGNVFLKNVLAVFDLERAQMRFYSRTY